MSVTLLEKRISISLVSISRIWLTGSEMTLSPIRWHQVPLVVSPTLDVAHNEPLAVYKAKSYKKKGWTTVGISWCAASFLECWAPVEYCNNHWLIHTENLDSALSVFRLFREGGWLDRWKRTLREGSGSSDLRGEPAEREKPSPGSVPGAGAADENSGGAEAVTQGAGSRKGPPPGKTGMSHGLT